MDSPLTPDATERKIKRLSMAVWILAILLCITVLVSFAVIRSLSVIRSDFERRSPESRIQSASVIALAKWERSDSTLRCVVTEILKQAPDTAFQYKVGDEISTLNRRVSGNADYGDGQVLFFTGSPAQLEEATVYRGDRITGLGDISITNLREIIARLNEV
jgi:hypothetical protein